MVHLARSIRFENPKLASLDSSGLLDKMLKSLPKKRLDTTTFEEPLESSI